MSCAKLFLDSAMLQGWMRGSVGSGLPQNWSPGVAVEVAVGCCLAWLLHRLVLFPLYLTWYYMRQGNIGNPFTPFIGDLPSIIRRRGATLPFSRWFDEYEREYGQSGDGSTAGYLIWTGPALRLRVTDPSVIQKILVTHTDKFLKPAVQKRTMGVMLGAGLITSDGELHHRHRKLVQPAFRFDRLRALTSLMVDNAAAAVAGWLDQNRNPDGSSTIDIHTAISGLTLQIICQAAFGAQVERDVGRLDDDGRTAAGSTAAAAAAAVGAITGRATAPVGESSAESESLPPPKTTPVQPPAGTRTSCCSAAVSLSVPSGIRGSNLQPQRLYGSINFFLSTLVGQAQNLVAFLPGWYYIPTLANLKLKRKVKGLRRALGRIVQARRAYREERPLASCSSDDSGGDNGGEGGDSVGRGDEILLDYLIDASSTSCSDGYGGNGTCGGGGGSVRNGCKGAVADSDHEGQKGQKEKDTETGTPHVVINTIDKRGNGSGNGHGYGCGRCGRSSIVNSTGPSSGVIKKNKSSQVLSDAEILDHAITFIIAGHETTSQALTWSLYLLCEHPEWMSKAVEEVSRVIGLGHPPSSTTSSTSSLPSSASSRLPAHDDIAAMPLVTSIIWEAMRLFPPVPCIARTASTDVDLGKVKIKGGTTVVVPIAGVHRDPRLWEGMCGALKHPCAYLPFSLGARNCIGQHFALLEARLILAVIIQRCSFEVDRSAYVHCPVMTITLRPEYGMPMRLVPRAPVPPAVSVSTASQATGISSCEHGDSGAVQMEAAGRPGAAST